MSIHVYNRVRWPQVILYFEVSRALGTRDSCHFISSHIRSIHGTVGVGVSGGGGG